jgi:hypothetical protein
VFEDVGFETAGETDAGTSLIFPGTRDVPDDGIIGVIYHPVDSAAAALPG